MRRSSSTADAQRAEWSGPPQSRQRGLGRSGRRRGLAASCIDRAPHPPVANARAHRKDEAPRAAALPPAHSPKQCGSAHPQRKLPRQCVTGFHRQGRGAPPLSRIVRRARRRVADEATRSTLCAGLHRHMRLRVPGGECQVRLAPRRRRERPRRPCGICRGRVATPDRSRYRVVPMGKQDHGRSRCTPRRNARIAPPINPAGASSQPRTAGGRPCADCRYVREHEYRHPRRAVSARRSWTPACPKCRPRFPSTRYHPLPLHRSARSGLKPAHQ
ncbi:hypothetical protein SAMN05216258_105392 [Albimonas pacifica]|uniref:Uncharacterized protein n=1 Tax=Albimonas pacifica TaxID=1114924 RepID=A0A1I3GX17_9RHOB|nr:hypothetical protein SAMN05216258_105392 [Albimonas pacifica]